MRVLAPAFIRAVSCLLAAYRRMANSVRRRFVGSTKGEMLPFFSDAHFIGSASDYSLLQRVTY